MENMLSQERDKATSIPMTDFKKPDSIQRERNHSPAPSTMKIGKRKVFFHSLVLGFPPENSEMQTLERARSHALILLMGDVCYLGKRVLDIVDSLRMRVMRLMRPREREINIDAFSNPEKYLVRLPIEKIVAAARDCGTTPTFLKVDETSIVPSAGKKLRLETKCSEYDKAESTIFSKMCVVLR
jgi:hypothetical protein